MVLMLPSSRRKPGWPTIMNTRPNMASADGSSWIVTWAVRLEIQQSRITPRPEDSVNRICLAWSKVKILYFDINGTIVRDYQCKPALAGGAFEQAVREAGFGRLVCMSNAQSFIKLLDEMGHAPNPLAIMFNMCWGAFRDADWFHQVTTLVPDPGHRALYIDVTTDWWYLDDLAKKYLEKEGLASLFETNLGRRILVPTASSDGEEILRWLTNSGASTHSGSPRSVLSC